MTASAERVVARFSEHQAGTKFRLPQEVEDALASGDIDERAVALWRGVSVAQEKAARSLSYGGFYAYWLNKCGENDLNLPKSLQKEQGTTHGPWQIRQADQVEDWVRQTLRTSGLLREVGQATTAWLASLAKPFPQAGANLGRPKALTEATREAERLQGELPRYIRARSYAIEFEKEVQFLLLLLAKDLDRTEILDAAKTGLFEALQSWTSDLRSDIDKLASLLNKSDA